MGKMISATEYSIARRFGVLTSEQLRAARGVLKLNQQAFADAIGVHVATIQRLEAGTGRVKTLSETEGRIETALKELGFVLVEDGVLYKPLID